MTEATQAPSALHPDRSTGRFDPAEETHYAISEYAEMHLAMLLRSMGTVAQLLRQQDQDGGGVKDEELADLLDTLAMAGRGAMGGSALVFPKCGIASAPFSRDDDQGSRAMATGSEQPAKRRAQA